MGLSMSRRLLSLLTVCSLTALTFADPIKKGPNTDKLAKECAEKFAKAIREGNPDDAEKLSALPFRNPQGVKQETFDEFRKQFRRPAPEGTTINVIDVVELSKLNELIKKKEMKELDDTTIKDYETYMGRNGRIVTLKIESKEPSKKFNELMLHLLIRIQDGQARVVGLGGR
jgi:hypothetical protein